MSDLLETIEDGIATLTCNRSERMNALSTPIMQGLLDGLPRLADDPTVKVVVLTGAGRAFCAGGDVKEMAKGREQREAAVATAHLRSRMEVSRILHGLPKPTIAMLNGPAAGAGLALALACDLRIAGTSARLVTAFIRVGFSGDFGGSWFLRGPAGALSLIKRNLNLAETGRLSELLDLEAANQVVTGRTEDHREAAKAFVEKRAPVFRGR